MNKAFEKILERLEENQTIVFNLEGGKPKQSIDYTKAVEIVQEVAEEYNGGWILCSEKMPPVETEVFIVAKRKWKDGTCNYITTTAMYEDGTVLENDSCWRWEDIEGEWSEEEDCYIIPEGWWENKHYNADDELNHAVDDEVIAWQPLPEPYKRGEGTTMKNKEKFVKEIFEIACEGYRLAVSKKTNKPCGCEITECADCAFIEGFGGCGGCSELRKAWCESEYVEP